MKPKERFRRSVACMQPPNSPTSNNASPDFGTARPPKRYIAPFASRIVQKSRRHGKQPDRHNFVLGGDRDLFLVR
jgi:hypothetical protein